MAERINALPSQSETQPGDRTSHLGGWLFRHRTVTALPISVALLTVPAGETKAAVWLTLSGMAMTAAGELVRLWAVRHIGAISRTRSSRLGPLVQTGPFAYVRNPLYLGNLAVWTGFALFARLVWLAPLVLVLLGAAYHAIVRWEEGLLESRLGDAYRVYARHVPRWIPALRTGPTPFPAHLFTWGETFFSERGTLMAIAAGYLLLWLKLRA
jgi:protein-S-isoprenylcysteine O-methyltransferase Ste14